VRLSTEPSISLFTTHFLPINPATFRPDVRSFFQPVHLYLLQFPNLLVEPIALRLVLLLLPGLTSTEHLGQRLQRLLLPGVDLAHMHLILRGQLVCCLLPLDRLQRYSRLELFAVPITLHLRPLLSLSLYLKGLFQILGPLYLVVVIRLSPTSERLLFGSWGARCALAELRWCTIRSRRRKLASKAAVTKKPEEKGSDVLET